MNEISMYLRIRVFVYCFFQIEYMFRMLRVKKKKLVFYEVRT